MNALDLVRATLLVSGFVVSTPAWADDPCLLDGMALDGLTGTDGNQLTARPNHTKVDTGFLGDKLSVVIGPDGVLRGSLPQSIREDTTIEVIVYRPADARYGTQIAGCETLGVRVQGDVPDAALAAPDGAGGPAAAMPDAWTFDTYELGRCNADHDVTVTVTVPDYPSAGAGCRKAERATRLRTTPVYAFSIGLGAVVTTGTVSSTGLDEGIGGQPSTAFERRSRPGLRTRVLLGWFPLGLSPTQGIFHRDAGDTATRIARRLFVGTLIDPEAALSSTSLVVGLQPVTGLTLFAGSELCHREDRLAGGLVNGAVFMDDSSSLPVRPVWTCGPHAILGIAATADLVTKLFEQ
jgi:hypothetical protein